jgi:hypothetical protein
MGVGGYDNWSGYERTRKEFKFARMEILLTKERENLILSKKEGIRSGFLEVFLIKLPTKASVQREIKTISCPPSRSGFTSCHVL